MSKNNKYFEAHKEIVKVARPSIYSNTILLFIKLFMMPRKKTFILPWQVLFAALLVYVCEEILTVLNMASIIIVPKVVFPLLETIIITLFIYVLLLQKESISK